MRDGVALDRPRSVSLIDGGWLEHARQGLVSEARWDLQSFVDLAPSLQDLEAGRPTPTKK